MSPEGNSIPQASSVLMFIEVSEVGEKQPGSYVYSQKNVLFWCAVLSLPVLQPPSIAPAITIEMNANIRSFMENEFMNARLKCNLFFSFFFVAGNFRPTYTFI